MLILFGRRQPRYEMFHLGFIFVLAVPSFCQEAQLTVFSPETYYRPVFGDTVILQCIVTSGIATTITWLKGGQVLTLSSNNRLSGGTPTTPSLTISNVQHYDGGSYVCRAANADSSVETNIIYLDPQGTPPVVTIPLPNYSQTYGQSITIACQVSSPNSPLQEVQWTFTSSTGQVTDPILTGTVKYSGSTTASPPLVINNLDFTDEGVYKCRARNNVGTTTSFTTARLNVQGIPPGSPEITVPSQIVEGQLVTMNCSSTGGAPPPSVRWFNGDYEITSNVNTTSSENNVTATVVFTANMSDHFSVYECQVENGILPLPLKKTESIFVNCNFTANCNISTELIPPGPAEIAIPLLILEGQSVEMNCSSTGGNPAPEVRWFKGNESISANVNTTTSGNTVTATLVFTATKSDHYAVYECQVDNGVLQNPLKETEVIVVNYPPDPPTLTGPTTLTAGEQGVWTCFSNDGFPAGVMTMKDTYTYSSFLYSQFTSTSTANGFGFDVTGTLIWNPTNNYALICCTVAHDTTLGEGHPQEVCLHVMILSRLAIYAPKTSYTPTIGNSVTLQCVVTSGTATTITWLKEGQALTISSNNRLSGGTRTTPSLTISNVQSSDGGNYVCRAADYDSTVTTATINLNPQGTPPVVTIPQQNVSQTYGQSITIACQVSSPNSPLQEVQWTFTNSNGQVTDPIVTGTGKYSGSTTTSPSLTINNLDFTDEGVYRCRARNLIGSTTSTTTATLAVQGTVPIVTIPQNSYSAVYGDQLVIVCNVNANPAVKSVVWQKLLNGFNTTINSGDYGYQGSTPASPSLTISFVDRTSQGTYTCIATNVVGTGVSNPARVSITGGLLTVSQSPTAANILPGSTTTITCTASGQPMATGVSWFFTPPEGTQQTLNITNRHSGAQPTNPSLTISNFQPTDAGTYVCRVSNIAGQATSPTTTILKQIERLILTITPNDPVNMVGDFFRHITCRISGFPQAFTVKWYRRPISGGDRTQITSSSKYTITSSFTSPDLIINNIQNSDEQDYFCEATNLAGTVTSSRSRLTVNGGLNNISISPANKDVIQGTNQIIRCTVTGLPSPAVIRWFFRPNGGSNQQLDIANSNGKYSDGTTTIPSLTVNDFQSDDTGAYYCQAINAAGTATSTSSVLIYRGSVPCACICSTCISICDSEILTTGKIKKMCEGKIKKMCVGKIKKMCVGKIKKICVGKIKKMCVGKIKKMCVGQIKKICVGNHSSSSSSQPYDYGYYGNPYQSSPQLQQAYPAYSTPISGGYQKQIQENNGTQNSLRLPINKQINLTPIESQNIKTVLRNQVQEYLYLGLEQRLTEFSATKENTKILKDWLSKNRHNPYPSKTEKVMLAYSTRMSMTQISNWFANSRRRIKQQKNEEKYKTKSANSDPVSEMTEMIKNKNLSSEESFCDKTHDSSILSINSINIAENEIANLSTISIDHEKELSINISEQNRRTSASEQDLTTDSGVESFAGEDSCIGASFVREKKCKTNLFGTDPVTDVTVKPLEEVKSIKHAQDLKTETSSRTNGSKIWSINDILGHTN